MTFDDLLSQICALLQHQGRVSYWALKRRFELTDEDLEGLKVELIQVQQVATDVDGKMLAWTGAAGRPTGHPSTPLQPVQSPHRHDARPDQGQARPVPQRGPEAERRQLTVLLCDLVDSTALAGQLDPEELRDVVRAYQATCADVIRRFEGHIAQYLGDGLLVYFGYPRAHEDDPQRAVHTGLGIVEAMEALNTRLERDKSLRLAVRVGIHTGLVVVGEMGGQGRQEQLALGETPNVAARLQGLADPNTVVMSAATHRLVQGFFMEEALGTHTLKGVTMPMSVSRVLHASGAQTRLDVAATRGLTPLVGRDSDVTRLLERWGQVKDGIGHVVLLTGEAGIGKSRLVQVVKERLAGEPHTRWEWRGSPYAQHSPLHPVIEHLHRLLQWRPDQAPAAKLRQLEAVLEPYGLSRLDVVPLLAALLSLPLPDRYPPLSLTPPRQKQRMLEAVLGWLLAEAKRQPVLFIMEDLHWIDPSTLEWLTLLIDQSPTARILALLTCRPEFRPPWAPRAHVTQITLARLPRTQAEVMVAQVAGAKALPAEVLQQVVAKTDGVPLFVEELTKMVLESGLLREREGRYELTGSLPPLAIPATLHDSLMARLDRLGAVKAVAQLAATLGRAFSYALVQVVSPLDEATLQHALARLVEAELLYQRGVPPQATYRFKHALIQEAAYQSVLKSTRQQSHRRIAQVLAERFPETAETQPELLAYHYTEAGLSEEAVGCWLRAGRRASERAAYVEAIAHLTKGLELLATLPDTPGCRRQELALQTTLGPALVATKGFTAPDVERVYARARELCQAREDTRQLCRVLWGLRTLAWPNASKIQRGSWWLTGHAGSRCSCLES